MQKSKLLVILAVLTFVASVATLRPQSLSSSEAEPDVELATAAKSAYMAVLAAYNTGDSSIDDLYRWSVRWMDAEGRSQPAKMEHLKRMEYLHRKVSALHAQSAVGGEDATFWATTFYVAEAKSILK